MCTMLPQSQLSWNDKLSVHSGARREEINLKRKKEVPNLSPRLESERNAHIYHVPLPKNGEEVDFRT